MTARVLLAAAGLLAAGLSPVFAESLTATVTAWEPATRTITLEDKSQFSNISSKVTVPPELKAGDEVTIEYQASDNGVDAINSITITKDIAKRLVPAAPKRS